MRSRQQLVENHGEPQQRVMGLTMPPPNLKPDFEGQAKAFVDSLVDGVLRREVGAEDRSLADTR
ncbi:MAG: hypothetical protein WB297_12600 [Actinomycetota bacterium]